MCKIVLVSADNLATKTHAYDMVEMVEDNIALTGAGYELAIVKIIAGVTVAQLRTALLSREPKHQQATKIPVAGKWTFKEEKTVWKDFDNVWKTVTVNPKYRANWSNMTADNWTTLANPAVSLATKSALVAKVKPCVALWAENLIAEPDLT